MSSSVTAANANAKGTPRSSHLSTSSLGATLSPTWAPPRSPLPPHRLAKLANALGVSTPMPAVHNNASFMSRSYSDSPGTSDTFRRSPTPSTPASNFNSYSPSISKFLLHVIPPLHLPHETDDDSDMTPPPSTASGYHTQFRRGTLVPVHATLQSQLGAIAKEYALPSTTGLILYLVSSSRSPQQTPSIDPHDDIMDEPGPRLSEDIWRHLWTRVMKTDQRDDTLIPSLTRSHSPNMFGISLAAQSTPFLPHESNGQPLRPFLSTGDTIHPQPIALHFPTSLTTSSTISDPRFNTKSTPPSSSSVSQSDPETPDTSSGSHSFLRDSETRANSLDLPGLHSPSIIPILAKVEFDIDRRKAPWYDPWLRSRKRNHAKRTESRSRAGRKGSMTDGGEGSEESQERHRHIDLLTGRKRMSSPVSLVISPAEDSSASDHSIAITPEPVTVPVLPEPEPEIEEAEESGYEQLEDEDEWSDKGSDSDEDFTNEFTARVATRTPSKDPLADVFGTDADTWAHMQGAARRDSKRRTNSNVVELAFSGADLTALPSPTQSEFSYLGREEDEVQALLDQMARPRLSVTIPASPPEKRSSSPAGTKKHVPPPLMLVPALLPGDHELAVPAEPSPQPSSAGSIGLAYLNDDESSPGGEVEQLPDEEEEFETDFTRVRSPAESEKRGGAVFDDLDLGLDPTEDFDEDDPHDRRRSQYLMRAQLDEIERTMAQFSPRILQTELADEQVIYGASSLSPNNSISLSPGRLNGEFYPPSPRLPLHPEPNGSIHSDSSGSVKQAAWPATPFASLTDPVHSSPPRRADAPPSPPRLAVNGITTSAPKSFMPNPRSSESEMSAESESRKRELDEERGYPALMPGTGRNPSASIESPIIPLSPDPFGRFSSTPVDPPGSRQSAAYWDNDATIRSPPITFNVLPEHPDPTQDAQNRKRSNSSATSRFSADSLTGENYFPAKSSNRSTLMTVNTIKRLWRKSGKNSNPPPTPTPASSRPPTPTVPPQRPERPSQEMPEPPKTPTFGRFSPQPVPPRPSQDPPQQQLAVPRAQQQQQQPMPPPPPQLSGNFNGRNPNPQPIVATQMRPSRGSSTLDHFHFDQESPYPTRRAPSFSARAPSPPAHPSPSPQTTHLPPPNMPNPHMPNPHIPPPSLAPPPMMPHPAEKEKTSIRKSILKGWKSSISGSNSAQLQPSAAPEPQPRASLERPNAGAPRGRRPSVLNFGSTRGSVTSPPPDIPPSPQVPQQFVINTRNDNRQSVRSKLTSSSIDSTSASPPQLKKTLSAGSMSPRRSMASSRSRDSRESRPSFDVSQFEIVSPKMNSTLSYPYHGLDHDP